ncbi:hypothetical protein [Croceimicrobium hydrocarbonivorans]|uniref:Lipocalin-like domain-containing protein n=1 Tax=Croceimicrobium hydrocarbonivorans TaxID=2761580 RepID=A0A7H0VII3_9FLAO|nr:hypothetical protein [Croceimicrobium hydrocarbonivorans]QNR25531.1 hypothetical protein H4K34_06735 [Croceimicrobium hydrocarbonivorans]
MKAIRLWSVLSLAFVVSLSSCSEDEDPQDNNSGTNNPVGIQGKWYSSGDNVAPLLSALFGTDSIYIEFATDLTYSVEQYDTNGAKLTLSGTYTQTESNVTDIWSIEVNQTAPAVLTSEGIFKVEGNTMQYEIVQTDPDIGATPPTPATGFGSSASGGTPLGTLNIQNYVRIQ